MKKQEMERLRRRWIAFYEQNNDTRWYVYAYRYPEGEPDAGKAFYIGKGCGERVFSHLDLKLKEDRKEVNKVKVITGLLERGLSPDIELLADGLSQEEALKLETVAIDAIGLENLTNIVLGHNSTRKPIGLSEKILEEAVIKHNMLGIKINASFPQYFHNLQYDSQNEKHQRMLYECTTLRWGIGAKELKKQKIKYYCAIYKGLILDVFKLDDKKPFVTVHEAIQKEILVRQDDGYHIKNFQHRRILSHDEIQMDKHARYLILFGDIAHDIREEYIGKIVKDINTQISFRYLMAQNNYES